MSDWCSLILHDASTVLHKAGVLALDGNSHAMCTLQSRNPTPTSRAPCHKSISIIHSGYSYSPQRYHDLVTLSYLVNNNNKKNLTYEPNLFHIPIISEHNYSNLSIMKLSATLHNTANYLKLTHSTTLHNQYTVNDSIHTAHLQQTTPKHTTQHERNISASYHTLTIH